MDCFPWNFQPGYLPNSFFTNFIIVTIRLKQSRLLVYCGFPALAWSGTRARASSTDLKNRNIFIQFIRIYLSISQDIIIYRSFPSYFRLNRANKIHHHDRLFSSLTDFNCEPEEIKHEPTYKNPLGETEIFLVTQNQINLDEADAQNWKR